MESILIKSKMLLCILAMSISIFVLAFSAMLLPNHTKLKDEKFLSDFYVTVIQNEDKLTVGDLNTVFNNEIFDFVIVNYSWSRTRAVPFTKNQFEALGINNKILQNVKRDDNIAVMNKKYLKMCYEKDNKYYIDKQGVSYEIIGTFEDNEDDVNNEITCYLNIEAKGLKMNQEYDCLFLDDFNKHDEKQINKYIEEHMSNVTVTKWSSGRYGQMDNRTYFVVVTAICAVIICMNCLIFAESWINSQKKELRIRILVGATKQKNNLFILKKYSIIFVLAFIIGVFINLLIFQVIRNVECLAATRELFGISLYAVPVFIAGIIVFTIGIVTIELQYLRISKNIMRNLTGEKTSD